jgi:hypothetical protein
MAKDRGKIKVRYTSKQEKNNSLSDETVQIFPVSRWIIALILAPTLIAAAFLSAFVFSILVPLFLFGGIILGIWIWWQRRKHRVPHQAGDLEGEFHVIRDIHIDETKADDEMGQ